MVEAALRGHPAVRARVDVVHGQAAQALVGATQDADLVLLQRSTLGPVRHHVGSTSRAVLREASCPVEVVPLGAAATTR